MWNDLQAYRIDAQISYDKCKPEQDVTHRIRTPLPDFQADVRHPTAPIRLQLITLVIQRHLVVSKDNLPKTWNAIKVLVKSIEALTKYYNYLMVMKPFAN